jgi:hypothetical protein
MKATTIAALVGIVGVFAGLVLGAILADIPLWVRVIWASGALAGGAGTLLWLDHVGKRGE